MRIPYQPLVMPTMTCLFLWRKRITRFFVSQTEERIFIPRMQNWRKQLIFFWEYNLAVSVQNFVDFVLWLEENQWEFQSEMPNMFLMKKNHCEWKLYNVEMQISIFVWEPDTVSPR